MPDQKKLETLIQSVGVLNEECWKPLAGVENRVPEDIYGRVRIRVGIGFGFLKHPEELRTAQAYNGGNAFALANTCGCSDVIVMEVWAKQEGRPEEKSPDPLICRAPKGECLIRCTYTLLPKSSISTKYVASTSILDVLELRYIE